MQLKVALLAFAASVTATDKTPLNFKSPRDPNTPTGIIVLRSGDQIRPGETCQVGSGECSEPAIEVHDGGGAGEFPVCAKHLPDVRALCKLLAEMTPDQISKFESAISAAENE